MAANFDDVSKAQYVSLTTFTKDGRPKPTPIWIARDGDRVVMITEKNSWKVKRIRNTPRVTLAVCDMRGNVKGEPVEAVATVLDDSHTEAVYRAINKRYGIVGRIFSLFSKLRGGAGRTVGLEIRPA
ncbi:MAG TPA: PPOX class F420-dependent oxidoreductase [Mycobacterium sp.]|uniref:PPOX class F420-dependent oxidoreductase n=1 Tax=Mycolicibacterium sp. TaxID=2320850 RepID=UPI0025E62538|nr:PPOX class F420-dependent oxidoreductase [Mycolicibacterium sp.]HPX37676.1 PPOX class F420-dependent oxidoreductase [Mycobacterium sp.]HQC77691.1 PPOX class F420-dependent oxidoreductase [Mycobacterium sp.]